MNLIRTCARLLSPPGPRGRLSVLIFHRVVPQVDPLFPGEVDAGRFDAILEWLSRAFNVVPLGDAVRGLAEGSLPSRALAITFDDGYADNHDVALPILRRRGVTATFFVATGFLDGGRMWNDTIIEAVRRFDGDALDLDALGLGRFDTASLSAKRAAIDALLTRLKHLPPTERASLTREVASRSDAALPDDLMMTSQKVRALRDAGMTIGGHTCSHPILAAVDADAAYREIAAGKRHLEEILDEPVRLFAYPNGKPGKDYHAEHVEMVRACGYLGAVSTASGVAHGGSDLLQIPRFTPWDRTPLRFGLRLVDNLRRVDAARAA